MIDVFLDNNAFQRFGEAIECHRCEARVRTLQETGELRASCSAYNLFEQLKGVTEDHWSEARDTIAQIYRFQLEIADVPVRFLLREFHPSYEAKLDRCVPSDVNLLWGLSQLSSYGEFVKYYGKVQELLLDLTAVPTPSNLGNEREVVARLKKCLNIANCSPFRTYSDMMSAFPSLKYPIFTLLSRRDLYPGWHFEARDYFDLLQLVYFQYADYFITQEKKLRKSINAITDTNLAGRAISLEDFIDSVMVQPFNLDKRAPETAQPLFFQKRN